MIKIALTAVITAVAGIVGYFLSDTFKERQAQKQRDKIAAGCAMTRTVYVREQDKALALAPGAVYTNTSEAVEWIVPRSVMTQLVIATEGLRRIIWNAASRTKLGFQN